MTGNASKLGVALAHDRLGEALPLVLAPALYVVGIAAGTAVIELRSRRPVFAAQAALVAAYMVCGSTVIHGEVGPGHARAAFYALEALAVVAFGLQTAALTEIAGAPVRTTYVSGPLTTMTVTAVRRALHRETPQQWLLLVVGIWVSYVVFATAGAFGLREISVWCLAFPLAALAALSAMG
jgi:uncharacterized membrane protein YoaK (UPF0700 family)